MTDEQIRAARIFRKFLLSKEQQEAVAVLGLRPADPNVKIGSPIEYAYGANSTANLILLEVPDTLVVDRLGETWHAVKKHAVIALVFDKSGSIAEGGKITAAIKGAQEFVRRMDGEDVLLWMPFDSKTYMGTQGPKNQLGEQLIQDIASTVANGDTALYDTVASAFDHLNQLHAQYGSSVRYGIVVLSDGQDTKSKTTLALLEVKLKPNETDPNGIQIHTIAIGSDADETVLKKIASAAHGRFWEGKSEKDMIAVYKEVATYY